MYLHYILRSEGKSNKKENQCKLVNSGAKNIPPQPIPGLNTQVIKKENSVFFLKLLTMLFSFAQKTLIHVG